VRALLALVAREWDRQVLRFAIPASVAIHFVERPAELRLPSRGEPPAAIVVEVQERTDSALEHALERLRRAAPRTPVWAIAAIRPDTVHEVFRLLVGRLVAHAIFSEEDIGAQLRPLLRRAFSLSEAAAVRRVWRKWTGPEARDILAACIEMSVDAATVEQIARELNKSRRALERMVVRAGLPSTHRLVSLCRLLRAAYRLEQPESNVKAVASALGYSSPRSLAKQLRRQTGFTIRDLRLGGFARLTAFVRAELFAIRAGGEAPARTIAHVRQRRIVGPR
jgi:AraC-like DNA-binding protein